MTNQNDLWAVGQTIADLYEVRGVNTEGGMSIVYFVWHKTWNKELVIKTPRPQLMKDQRSRDDFTREAETWVKLGMHPNIVTAFYVREIDGFPRIIVEKMNGGSLKEWLARGKVPDLATALDIAIQVAGGLAYAQKHQPDFVHRDLKPANVLMTPGGTAKVTDFGLAGVVGKQVGTPAYMAPEVWREAATITPAADWYSFGVVLYELLTGRRPFDRDDKGVSLGQIQGGMGVEGSLGALREPVMATDPSQRSLGEKLDMQRVTDRSLGEVSLSSMDVTDADMAFYREAHLNQTPRAPIELNASIPEELNALCLDLLAKDAEKRLTDTAGIIQRLKTIYESSVGMAYPRPEPKEVDLAADSMNNYALSMLDLGKPEEAEKYWAEALKKHPGHLESTYNQGLHLWRCSKINIEELLRRLRESDTQVESWRRSLLQAWVYLESVESESCKAIIELLGALNENDRMRPDISLLLKLAGDKQAASPQLVKTLEFSSDHAFEIAHSPDKTTIVIYPGHKAMKLLDVDTGDCHFELQYSPYRKCFSISPDGRQALSRGDPTTSGSDKLIMWEIGTGRCLQTFEGHTADVIAACFSPDGQQVLSASGRKTMKLWNVATGRCVRIFKEHAEFIGSVCFSPDGRNALSWSSDDNFAGLWDVGTGEFVRTLGGHSRGVYSACFSPDGRQVLSGSEDKTIKLWGVATGQCLRTFAGHKGGVLSVCFSPDGQHALSGSYDATMRLWVIETGQCVRIYHGHRRLVRSIALTSDGRHAISQGGDCNLNIWKLGLDWSPIPAALLLAEPLSIEVISEQEALLNFHLNEFDRSVKTEHALSHLMEIRRDKAFLRHPEVWRRWCQLAEKVPQRKIIDEWQAKVYGFKTLALSSDGRYALSTDNSMLKLWHLATGVCVQTFKGHRNWIESADFSPDGRYALSASKDNTWKLWDVATGQCVRTFEGHTESECSLCFSPDGRYALSGSKHWGVKLWDMTTGRCLQTFDGLVLNENSYCFSPDGRQVLSAGRYFTSMILWDVATGWCVRTFKGHTGKVCSMCCSSDGRYALSGSDDHTLKLWDVATGKCVRSFEGHTHTVCSVCFSSNSRYALSGSYDKTVKLWDVTTGECVRTFEGHTPKDDYGFVWFVAFNPEGTMCYSSAIDKSFCWNLDWELEYKAPADWDEKALPYLNIFLTLHTPYAGTLPTERAPTEDEIRKALTRCGTPVWTEEDFQALIIQLGPAGYGWLRPEGIKRELEAMVDQLVEQVQQYRAGLAACDAASCDADAVGHLRRIREYPSLRRHPDVVRYWRQLAVRHPHVGLVDGWQEGEDCESLTIRQEGRYTLETDENVVKLVDAVSGEVVRTFKGHTKWVKSVCFGPGGRYALSGSDDETLKLWDVGTGICIRTLEGHTAYVRSVGFSPDGRYALSGGDDRTLRLWDVRMGKCMRTFEEQAEYVLSVCFSPDARYVLSRGGGNTFKLWNVATGECVRIFEGHSANVGSVCFSPDGRYALSGSDDMTVKLWDMATGACLRTFEGHTEGVDLVCFSPDGTVGISSNNSETIRWYLDWELEIKAPVDWDEGARPYLQNFLTLHTPYAGSLPTDRAPTEDEVRLALTRRGKPIWMEEDFQGLMKQLGPAGYGWLRPEGVRKELEAMAGKMEVGG